MKENVEKYIVVPELVDQRFVLKGLELEDNETAGAPDGGQWYHISLKSDTFLKIFFNLIKSLFCWF